MKMSAITRFSICFLLSMAPLASAQSSATATQSPTPTQRPAAPATSDPTRRTAVAPDYKLVNGDKLRIEVYKDQQLSQSLQIRPDGKITLPLLGDIVAAGRTSTELRDVIAAALKEYITNPVVTVIVTETVPPLIYVMGEVHTPGPQPFKEPMSIMQALATAGGFGDFANTKDVQVLRQTAAGQTTLHFNYKDAVKGKAKLIYLQPGDTVIVR